MSSGPSSLFSAPSPAAVTPASVGSHHAGDIVAAPCASAAVTLASVGSHHAGDIVLAVAFYNVGVLNTEVSGKNWKKPMLTGKAAKLKCEIDAMFASDQGIEVVYACADDMYACADDKWRTSKPVGSTQKRSRLPIGGKRSRK